MQPEKPFWQSTTLWINAIGIIAIGLQLALNQQLIPTEYQELVLAILNIANRFRAPKTVSKLTMN